MGLRAGLAGLLSLGALLSLSAASAQEYQGQTLVRAELIADVSSIEPGKPFTVGLLLETAEDWHVYWENTGDAGMPTQIDWALPEGFTTEPIEWPLPRRFIEPGDLHAFGYEGRVLLMVRMTPPAELSGTEVTLSAKASWLVCKELCVPGSANVHLTLPVGPSQPNTANAPLFAATRADLPRTSPPPYPISWQTGPEAVTLAIRDVPEGTELDFLTLTDQGVHIQISRQGETVTLTIPTTIPVRGLLIATAKDGGRTGWILDTPGAAPPQSDDVSPGTDVDQASRPETSIAPPSQTGLLRALLLGFLGGLILNLMPCVLPVISLKIFGFIRQAGDSPSRIFRHGLAFTAGIFAWFLGLGGVVIGIQVAGGRATWAFQFQNPWFNLAISAIVFVFALNLLGVFEIILPGRAARAMDETGGGAGYGASFFQGAFATLLATPCTAPFLGSALGFAFSQPPALILLMFAAVAAGMAAPYLLLSAQPGWLGLLPRPGAWMERLKQFMAFPLLATLLWLLSILGSQKGTDAVIWAGAFLLSLWLALWIYGAFCGPLSGPRVRATALLLAVLVAALGTWVFAGTQFAAATRQEKTTTPSAEGIPWEPFSRETLDRLLAEKKAVFVDFTADWCLTCKFNKKTALDRPAIREAFEKAGITPLLADWTNADPEITEALAKFGRVGVPFYLLYPAGKPDQPLILPELLTERIVLDAIRQASQFGGD